MGIFRHIDSSKPFPQRIVSLVPSMTASLFDLGMGHLLVGVTEYCVHPAERIALIPKIGGTKNFEIEKIIALAPDLVIANQEENTWEGIEELAHNCDVWLVFPQSVGQAIDDLWEIVHHFRNEVAFAKMRSLETAVEFAELALVDHTPINVFVPIWLGEHQGHPWWMTFNGQTYANDVLRLLGGRNVFTDRVRKYPLGADLGLIHAVEPGERDIRYPCVTTVEIITTEPEVILLPSEPYPFSQGDLDFLTTQLKETPAVQQGKVFLIDGSLLTWYGTWIGKALAELGDIIN
jgi:ABC-type Fe3+-hydroxamate transport system substrate-binding protein